MVGMADSPTVVNVPPNFPEAICLAPESTKPEFPPERVQNVTKIGSKRSEELR
jgi:hypothetical protein